MSHLPEPTMKKGSGPSAVERVCYTVAVTLWLINAFGAVVSFVWLAILGVGGHFSAAS